jgi:general secretion pathway protein B
MSYILDALRKAERDRHLGRTPSLGDVTANPPRVRRRRPSPRTLGLLALVAALVICSVWLWPRDPARPPVQQALAVAPVPPAPPLPPPVAAPIASEPSVPSAAAAALPSERTLAPDVPADSIDDLMGDAEVPAAPPSEPEAEPESEPESAAAEPVEPDLSTQELPGEPVPLEQQETTAAPEVPLLRDMPTDYRASFPLLRVDVHVYDDDPARRWVMVNGRKAVEGSTLSEGPTVSRITPEGIVFDFRGRSALLPLNR